MVNTVVAVNSDAQRTCFQSCNVILKLLKFEFQTCDTMVYSNQQHEGRLYGKQNQDWRRLIIIILESFSSVLLFGIEFQNGSQVWGSNAAHWDS